MRTVLIVALLAACSPKPGGSTPAGGAGDCNAHAEVAACRDAPECRWLSPGCAEGDEQALPESATGCYPATDPCDGKDCGSGAECREVVINPCLPDEDGVACDACGQTIKVCLPAS